VDDRRADNYFSVLGPFDCCSWREDSPTGDIMAFFLDDRCEVESNEDLNVG
jgi:hypothetical protein